MHTVCRLSDRLIRGLIRVDQTLQQLPLRLESLRVLLLIVQDVTNADQVECVEAHHAGSECKLPILYDPRDHGERKRSDRHRRQVTQTVEASCALASGHWCHHRG